MVFLPDSPVDYEESLFHQNTYKRLLKMSKDNAIPHLIFHGPSGAGKKTMTNIFLKMIYDESIDNLYSLNCDIYGSGNKVKTEVIQKSNHHIIINPTGTNFDRYLVHEVIKKYASMNTIESLQNPNSKFRTILISNLDRLSQNAQTCLRRMIEVNADKCRFIMWCDNLSNVIGPLRSRCVRIRVPRPKPSEMFAFLVKRSLELSFDPAMNDIMEIVRYVDGNIKNALWYLQLYILGCDIRKKNNFTMAIDSLHNHIMRCNLSEIEEIRNILFNMMITNYDAGHILREMVNRLIDTDQLPDVCKVNIILKFSQTEYNMIRGRRDIIHFDAFITEIMNMIEMSRKKPDTPTNR